MALDKGRLEEIATAIALMYDPEVYSKLKTEINKPMADVPAGHALNINWDNIVNSYKVIKDFLKETLYKEDMSMENVGSKLVQRGTSGGIKVGDIYTTTPLNNGAIASNSGIAYKDSDGIIKYTNNFTEFRNLIEINKNGIVEDIRMAGKVVTYAHAPEIEGYVVTRYDRSGDRGGGYITQRTLQKKINGAWYTIAYYEGV